MKFPFGYRWMRFNLQIGPLIAPLAAIEVNDEVL